MAGEMLKPGGFGGPPAGSAGEVLVRFLPVAAGYVGASVLLGAGLAVADALGGGYPYSLRWIHVHLALAMGLTHAIVGAVQYFAVPLLATSPPPAALLRVQLVLLNAGAAGLVTGFAAGRMPLVAAGGTLVLAGMLALIHALRVMARRSLTRIGLSMRYYLTATGFGVVGMSLGVLIVAGWLSGLVAPASARLAHLHLNLLGWVGLTIVGTQFTLFPTVTGTALWRERLAIPTFWLLSSGAGGTALGFLLGLAWLVIAGGSATLLGAIVFVAVLAGTRRRLAGPLPLSGRHLYASAWYLVATCIVGVVLAWQGGAAVPGWRVAYAHLGLVGFVLQTLIGAMVHLFPVLGAVYGGSAAGNLAVAAGGPAINAGGPTIGASPATTNAPPFRQVPGRGERLARLKRIMDGHAGLQFWFLNAGVLGFATTRVVAGALRLTEGGIAAQAFRLATVASSLCMLAAFILLLLKVTRALAAAR